MLKLKRYDLSVIVASSRPKWLANCLSQLGRQSHGGLSVEPVVVTEGDDENFGRVIDRFGIKKHIAKSLEGFSGAFAKDLGVRYATGDYVCYWDDDNIYYDHALATLYSAAVGFDIGVVGCGLMAFDFDVIPRDHEIRFANIDTMCVCVRRTTAMKAKWSDHRDVGTDFAWLKKLKAFEPTVRFVDIKIGEHLNG